MIEGYSVEFVLFMSFVAYIVGIFTGWRLLKKDSKIGERMKTKHLNTLIILILP